MKIRSSTKIAITFVVLVFGGYFGWQLYAGIMVDGIKFDPIKPSRVNIIGIKADSGYRILVANLAAQLIRGGKDEFENGSGPESSDASEKKRIPLREMLRAMQGDAKALGEFVMIMNDMNENDEWPSQHVVWKDGDLRKALDGDPILKAKLEKDINIHLDGTPLKQISLFAYENGIIVETYVPCKVQVGNQVVDMVGPIQIPYRPNISKTIAKQLEEKAYTLEMVAAHYSVEGAAITGQPSRREDVAATLRRIIDPKTNEELARPAQQVLQSATIVVSDAQITSASMRSYQVADQKFSDIELQLTDEGRKRLWQYSRRKVGSQLLLIANGVAIAAPRIRHELAQGELEITQLPDKILAQDAVDSINNRSGASTP